MNVTSYLDYLERFLPGLTFVLLFLLMLSYWSQAAVFGQERYKAFNNLVSFFSISSLATLLIFRWIESGHFPLSNLYESLLFLSWCFLSVKLLFGPKLLTSKGQLPSEPFTGISKHFNRSNLLKPFFKSFFTNKPADEAPSHKALYPTQNGLRGVPPRANPVGLERELHLSSLGLGVVLSPLSLLSFGFAFLSLPKEMQKATALVPALQSNWLMMHVTVMILSYAALLSGSLLSIAFLILNRLEGSKLFGVEHLGFSTLAKSDAFQPILQERRNEFFANACAKEDLQGKVLCNEDSETIGTLLFTESASSSLPAGNGLSIDFSKKQKGIDSTLTARLDNYSYRILALGFPLLTIGILSGAVWANEAWGSYWSWDPKETWALITWLVFAIYLHTRITKGWSGEKPAIVASIGFFMVWFCYLGVNLLGSGLHSYGWFSK